MSQCYPKSKRLRARHQYRRLAYSGNRSIGKLIAFDFKQNHLSHPRLGITVTKRFGKAHERNRFKRLVREAYRIFFASSSVNVDFNVKPLSVAKTATLEEVYNDLSVFFQKNFKFTPSPFVSNILCI